VKRLLSNIILTILALFLILPFIWMALVSLHPPKSPLPDITNLLPKEPVWGNYGRVMFDPEVPVFRFFLNSLAITMVVVCGQLVITSLAAFALARLTFWGRDALFWLVLSSMMFAGVVTQIPVFLMMKNVGWLNTYWALIIPGLSSSFNIFLLRQFMVGLPKELDEAAALDGASSFQVYSKVVLPLCGPALATAGAFSFFAVWTDFFWPLLVTNSMDMRTLEVGLSIFKNSYGTTNWPLQMAAALLTLAPLVLLFLFVQRWFVRGIQMSGIK
jgi:multiple sugar transport system permease protein